MLSDIEIANSTKITKITEIAKNIGLKDDDIELYGNYKAKISNSGIDRVKNNTVGKLVLVTAINPTPAGEGKTTVTVGLGQAMAKIGQNAIIALREPSLGPVFGIKGGAAGGGYSQVLPMEDINLHFTGDIHAVTAANNLLCAMIDNHIYQGNDLNIDQRRVLVNRCIDINDRTLRKIVLGLGSKVNGIPREDSFTITVASEVMAILCLAESLEDLKNRLGNMFIAYTFDDKPIFAHDILAEGAMASLLKDAIKPNLVQTIEGTPALMHGGPFANIAHGCNSVRATKLGLKLADYCITEAGFGSDLGAEKFFDIKCRKAGLTPSAVVLVATVRALKYNGGIAKSDLKEENVDALKKGLPNLERHISNLKKFGIPVVVSINRFVSDTDAELSIVSECCKKNNVECALCEVFTKGGEGGKELASLVVKACEQESHFKFIYDSKLTIKEKIFKIATEIYGADDVRYSSAAEANLDLIEKIAPEDLPVCIAKTQFSFSDDPTKLGCPKNFKIKIREIKYSAGAGFVVAITNNVMTMPGLPKHPAAEIIDISNDGIIKGLF